MTILAKNNQTRCPGCDAAAFRDELARSCEQVAQLTIAVRKLCENALQDANMILTMAAERVADRKRIADLEDDIAAWEEDADARATSQNLVPCPFCKKLSGALVKDDEGISRVECRNEDCLASGPPSCEGPAVAVDLWNRAGDRPVDPRAVDTVEDYSRPRRDGEAVLTPISTFGDHVRVRGPLGHIAIGKRLWVMLPFVNELHRPEVETFDMGDATVTVTSREHAASLWNGSADHVEVKVEEHVTTPDSQNKIGDIVRPRLAGDLILHPFQMIGSHMMPYVQNGRPFNVRFMPHEAWFLLPFADVPIQQTDSPAADT